MKTVQQIYETLCSLAPLELQLDFDNAGFLVGRSDTPVERVLLALDVTPCVIDEALEKGARLIVSHHPVIFDPVRSITERTPEGLRLLRLIENGLSVISMHTNLDIADGGINDVLIRALGAEPVAALDENGCGRIGVLPQETTLADFLARCRAALPAKGLRYLDAQRPVHRLAVMGGSGADSIACAAALGCDTFVTADVKYHDFQYALDLGINLIDADHFGTEQLVIPALQQKLQQAHPELAFLVSERHRAIVSFYV